MFSTLLDTYKNKSWELTQVTTNARIITNITNPFILRQIQASWIVRRGTVPHCVLLKHYYSVDLPWWFDRKIFFSFYSKSKWKNLSNDRNSKLHFAIWQKNCFRWILSASNQSGSQIHVWILLKKKFYCIRIYSIFCRASPFHREWLALINILTI